jgi:methyl-accepting chemotaxis protein
MFGLQTIKGKAWLIAGLMLVPQVLQGYVIVTRSQADIAFAAKERVGIEYLRAFYPVHAALDEVIALKSDLSNLAVAREHLGKVASRLDEELTTGDASRDALNALKSGSGSEAHAKADKALGALLARVGDQSNLILDPDLDSFYLMSLVVDRIPEITRHAAHAQSVFAQDMLKELGVAQSELFGFSIGNMNGELPKILRAGQMAISSTKSKAIIDPVLPHLQKLETATLYHAEVLQSLREALTLGNVTPLLRKSFLDSSKGMFAANHALYDASLAALDKLLEARISGFEWGRNRDILVILVVMAVVYAISLFVAAHILRSLWLMRKSIENVAAGNMSSDGSMSVRRDEIGAIGRAIDRMRTAVTTRLAENFSAEKEDAIAAEQRRAMQGMATELERSVAGSIGQIDRLAAELKQAVAFVDESARNTGMAVDQSSASLHTSIDLVKGAADGLQELSLSTSEIASQTVRAANASRDAMQAANETIARADEFEKTVAEINGIVRFVEQIAQQTNLLALNATIEAARAGAAGRGFAVVAAEVKALAQQTAQATHDIGAKVAAVSSVGTAMGLSVRSVVSAIQSVDEVATSIAAAVEQHDVTTADINQRIQTTVADSVVVAHQIEEVAGMASSTREVSEDLAVLSAKMENEARHLSAEMVAFMAKIAA